jgi:hypothetical protein
MLGLDADRSRRLLTQYIGLVIILTTRFRNEVGESMFTRVGLFYIVCMISPACCFCRICPCANERAQRKGSFNALDLKAKLGYNTVLLM